MAFDLLRSVDETAWIRRVLRDTTGSEAIGFTGTMSKPTIVNVGYRSFFTDKVYLDPLISNRTYSAPTFKPTGTPIIIPRKVPGSEPWSLTQKNAPPIPPSATSE